MVTDEGITGWGECFGPGNVAIANKVIVERVIQPMILEENPLNRDVLWHKVYNLLRDHGQKGMPIQALFWGGYCAVGHPRQGHGTVNF